MVNLYRKLTLSVFVLNNSMNLKKSSTCQLGYIKLSTVLSQKLKVKHTEIKKISEISRSIIYMS